MGCDVFVEPRGMQIASNVLDQHDGSLRVEFVPVVTGELINILHCLFRRERIHFVTQARFPFKRNRLRCVRCVNENRKKRKRLRWQAANHGCQCHCFDRAFLLAGAYASASQ